MSQSRARNAVRVMDAEERYMALCRVFGETIRMVPDEKGVYAPDYRGTHAHTLEQRAMQIMRQHG